MASAACRTVGDILAALPARTLKDDIDSLTSGDTGKARMGAVSLLAKLNAGPTDCAKVIMEKMGAAALVVALRTLPRFSGEHPTIHLHALNP